MDPPTQAPHDSNGTVRPPATTRESDKENPINILDENPSTPQRTPSQRSKTATPDPVGRVPDAASREVGDGVNTTPSRTATPKSTAKTPDAGRKAPENTPSRSGIPKPTNKSLESGGSKVVDETENTPTNTTKPKPHSTPDTASTPTKVIETPESTTGMPEEKSQEVTKDNTTGLSSDRQQENQDDGQDVHKGEREVPKDNTSPKKSRRATEDDVDQQERARQVPKDDTSPRRTQEAPRDDVDQHGIESDETAVDGPRHATSEGVKKRRSNAANRGTSSREMSKPKTTDGDKFPGYDEYPLLSIHENDRETRARVRAYYGVRFAPWNIPFKRRLQTMAVLLHSLSIATAVSFFFFLCAIPLTWPILIPYFLRISFSTAATDGKLRSRSERWRRAPLWKFFADYYPARLHKTHDLPPTRKYIFGYHPHGIISHGAFAAFGTEALGFAEKFPGITNSLLTLDSNFRIPLYREYILSLGIQSVSKESITNILTVGGPNNEGMGRAVTIVVGGARESLEAYPGTMHLVLAERKGFIRLAIRTGADLVPVLAFGENDLYDQVSPKTHPWLARLQMHILKTLKFTLPFLHGRGIFNYDVGLMPYRRPLNVVVGKPIKVKQVSEEKFDPAEVERLHKIYVEELRKMWERYKDVFAPHRKEEMVIQK